GDCAAVGQEAVAKVLLRRARNIELAARGKGQRRVLDTASRPVELRTTRERQTPGIDNSAIQVDDSRDGVSDVYRRGTTDSQDGKRAGVRDVYGATGDQHRIAGHRHLRG